MVPLLVVALLVAITIPTLAGTGTSSAFSGFSVPAGPGSLPQGTTGPQRRAVTDSLVVVSTGCFGSGWGVGTGWPINTDHVMTAAHVVGGTNAVEVMSQTQRALPATVVAINDLWDVAVLYVPGAHFSSLPMAGDDALGRPLIAIGYPNDGETVVRATYAGLTTTVDNFPSQGTVRTLDQMQADIAPGFSGGPVVDDLGQVVAMTIERLPETPGVSAAVPLAHLDAVAASAGQLQSSVPKGPCATT